MDRFSRIYLGVVSSILVVALAWYWLAQDGRVDEINARLDADHVLAAYPFTFRVLALDHGVATVSSPRSAEVAAMQFLRAAYPELLRTSVDHPDMMAAQDVLAATQTRAAKLIRNQPDVTSLRWEVDERWFNERGVFLDLRR